MSVRLRLRAQYTLCDSAEDEEAGEDACVKTGAQVKWPVPEVFNPTPTPGLGQDLQIIRLTDC